MHRGAPRSSWVTAVVVTTVLLSLTVSVTASAKKATKTKQKRAPTTSSSEDDANNTATAAHDDSADARGDGASERPSTSKAERLIEARKTLQSVAAELETMSGEGATSDDGASDDQLARIEAQLSELNERLEYVEGDMEDVIGVQDKMLSTVQRDRLSWFGDYRLTMSNISYRTRPSFDARDEVQNEVRSFHPSLWSHRLRLGFTFDLGDRVRFYARLVFYKDFGATYEGPIYFDSNSTRFPRDTLLRLERAYMDWFITDWLVFTAGRVAAPEGPPVELRENQERSATWGVNMVEAEFETLMLTLHLSALLEDTYLRIFYFPFSSVLALDAFNPDSLFLDVGIAPMHVFGTLYEMRVPGIGKNILQVGSIFVPEFKPRYLPLDDVFPEGPYPTSLGWMAQLAALFEWQNIVDSGLDLFAAYTYTYLSPNNGRVRYDLGDGVILPIGLASYDDPTQNQAHFAYTGFRYTAPFFDALSPKVGAELNWGSKHHVLFGSPSELRVNKLATRGLGFETYWIQPLVENRLFARLGVLHIQRQFEGTFIGPATPVDTGITNFYGLLHATW